jgi:hypothetical protein
MSWPVLTNGFYTRYRRNIMTNLKQTLAAGKLSLAPLIEGTGQFVGQSIYIFCLIPLQADLHLNDETRATDVSNRNSKAMP